MILSLGGSRRNFRRRHKAAPQRTRRISGGIHCRLSGYGGNRSVLIASRRVRQRTEFGNAIPSGGAASVTGSLAIGRVSQRQETPEHAPAERLLKNSISLGQAPRIQRRESQRQASHHSRRGIHTRTNDDKPRWPHAERLEELLKRQHKLQLRQCTMSSHSAEL